MAPREHVGRTQAENLLTILAHDDVHGKIVARLINPDLFEGDLRVFAEKLKKYWDDFGKAPKLHAADLFTDVTEDPHNRKAATYRRILKNMVDLQEGINVKYVLREQRTHARVAHIRDAVLKVAETLNAKEALGIEESEILLANLLNARQFEFDAGMTLRDVDKVMDFLDNHYQEFRIGIEPFDRRYIVPARGAVLLFLAPTGVGKSWFLPHVGRHALMQRKKVLHLTLEMPAEEVLQRYYMNLFSVSKRKSETEVATFELDENGRLNKMGGVDVIEPSFRFDQASARKKLKNRVGAWSDAVSVNSLPDRLRVQRFAPRSLSIAGLRANLDALEAMGFTPDMCILDYIGIMKTDADNHRISLGRVMEEFRAVMVERNMAGVTAHQVGRAGSEALTVKPIHVAEDWSLIGTVDMAVTMSRTPAEKRVGLARLLVAKSRSEADNFGVVITQSYDLGQFALQAAMANRTYWDYVKHLPKSPEEQMAEKANDNDE